MKHTKATDIALHIVVFLIAHHTENNISVHVLAKRFNVSQTYLSKILTQLVKAGIISSTSGANGGYILNMKAEDISFLDVIQAIEGTSSVFSCAISEDKNSKCGIRRVMAQANDLMDDFFQSTKLIEISEND